MQTLTSNRTNGCTDLEEFVEAVGLTIEALIATRQRLLSSETTVRLIAVVAETGVKAIAACGKNFLVEKKVSTLSTIAHTTPTLPCGCRRPQPGMLLAAAQERGIDLAASWMAGDSESDVEAGRRAGCRTIRIGLPEVLFHCADEVAGSFAGGSKCDSRHGGDCRAIARLLLPTSLSFLADVLFL
jgi:beta-phosphoglucomutase-like phosphatase (HAD superfamily)